MDNLLRNSSNRLLDCLCGKVTITDLLSQASVALAPWDTSFPSLFSINIDIYAFKPGTFYPSKAEKMAGVLEAFSVLKFGSAS